MDTTNTGQKASMLEKILLVWVLWSFLAILANAAAPGGGGLVLYPIVVIGSFFGDAQATIVGAFQSFGISLGFIAWGLMYSTRARKNKKNATLTSV